MGKLKLSLGWVAACLHSPNIPALCTRFQAGLFRFSSEVCLLYFFIVEKLHFDVVHGSAERRHAGAVLCPSAA